MTVTLIIARHGNTFASGETPRRIGARTDLPLVPSGHEQATKLGLWLKANNLLPQVVYTSRLKRAIETAQGAIKSAGLDVPIIQSEMFDEIDHGPDENKPDPEIVARIGAHAFNAWENANAMPLGWSPPVHELRARWLDFAKTCETQHDGKTVLVVTSNGLARFSPLIANNAEDVLGEKNRKMSTGAISIFEGSGGLWMINRWNVKP